jgi:hypothetical protein
MPRPVFGLAAVICASLASAGCETDGQWSFRKALGWDDPKVPNTSKFPKADLATAERVETIGRKIIAQNTFTGLDPLFHTIGVPESVLFHRGPDELVISEGLAKQCKTESELAAVLCSELGQMAAERKAAKRVGSDRDSFPEVGLPGGGPGMSGGGTPDDPGRAAERAYQERRPKPASSGGVPDDPAKLAREFMRGAGYDPAELDRVAPLLKQSDRGAILRKQLSGSAPAPKWDR